MTQPRSVDPADLRQKDKALAEELAGEILGFLAADAERLRRFLDLTGLTPETLRSAARAPGFATGLLDYLGSDDRLLIAFAGEKALDPARLEAARLRLARADHQSDP